MTWLEARVTAATLDDVARGASTSRGAMTWLEARQRAEAR